MKWIICLFVLWLGIAGNANVFGQDEEAPPERPYYTIEQLQGAQADDLESLNKLRDQYLQAFENDETTRALRLRIQMRQGMINRELLLLEKGVINEKALKKLEERK